ncbi:MAG: TetR/AcrR family transcriptional regulator [Lachnospiraceae bacterium]|nr:TetR/AcrR family transcriptional regulator [Lachnospiraceae bacterium]
MAAKGEKTRAYILDASYALFAQKGFKQVTMKDICEITGMSRGGLYSHFSSTGRLFEALLEKITYENTFDIEGEIDKGTPAAAILRSALTQMQKGISHPEDSLSVAIYEYAQLNEPGEIIKLNHRAEEKWARLINYGIKTGEFKDVDVREIVSMILYSYQGLRMWSRIIPIKKKTSDQIINHIRKQLITEDGRNK